jgi:hypothetical protein
MKQNHSINGIPHAIAAVITLGRNARAGALSVGAAVGLQHNPAGAISGDFFDFAGDPATPAIPGKQAKYAAQVVAVKDAHAAKREAIAQGREFCRAAINVLRPVLGNEWNTAWQAAGFHQPSLALPTQPVAMLTQFRAYFGTHAAQENAAMGVTAAAAEAKAAAIDAAILAVGAAKNLRVLRKQERDESLTNSARGSAACAASWINCSRTTTAIGTSSGSDARSTAASPRP